MDTVLEILLQVGQTLVDKFGADEKVAVVLAYILGVWVIFTAIKFIAGFIIQLTKNQEDDAVFKKICDWIDKYLSPIFKLLPHSTIQINKIFTGIVDGAKWIISFFQKKEEEVK